MNLFPLSIASRKRKKEWLAYIGCALIFLLLTACRNNKVKQSPYGTENIIGKEIKITTNIPFLLLNDTLKNLPKSDYTIINYIDSSDCVACNLYTLEWKFFMEEIESSSPHKVTLVVYVLPQEKDRTSDLKWILIGDDFNYPVCFDKENNFARINQLPVEKMFHTFLLDADYKIVLVGNPITHPSIREKYKSTLCAEQ